MRKKVKEKFQNGSGWKKNNWKVGFCEVHEEFHKCYKWNNRCTLNVAIKAELIKVEDRSCEDVLWVNSGLVISVIKFQDCSGLVAEVLFWSMDGIPESNLSLQSTSHQICFRVYGNKPVKS